MLKNNDDKSFQYAITFVLNYKNIVKDTQKHQELSLSLINTIGKK